MKNNTRRLIEAFKRFNDRYPKGSDIRHGIARLIRFDRQKLGRRAAISNYLDFCQTAV